MSKSKKPIYSGPLLRELVVMNEIRKLVEQFYPEASEQDADELFRVFTWSLSKFSPEPATTGETLRKFLTENIDKVLNPKLPPFPAMPFPGAPLGTTPPGSPPIAPRRPPSGA